MPLESVDNVERCDRLALGVLSVGDGVADDTLKEGLEDTPSLVVDHFGTSQTIVSRNKVVAGDMHHHR